MKRFRRAEDAGFTLVEVLVVVVLLGVVGAVFASTVIQATRVDDRTRTRADAQYAVSLAIERLTKEVRVAAPLVSVSPTQVVVDVYPTQPAGSSLRQRHTFTLASGALTQQVQQFTPATSTTPSSTSTRPLATGLDLTASSFAAFDRAGAATTNAAKVASFRVSLRRTTQSAKPVDASTTIYLRNYKG
jgi:MSHA biogenesis protein MshO